jgi:hypothetical protein
MKVNCKLILIVIIGLTFLSSNFMALAKQDEVELTIIELKEDGKSNAKTPGIPPTDNAMSNPDYKLLRYRWYTTASYYVNTANTYGFSEAAVTATIQASAETWDGATSFEVFTYVGTTTSSAGVYDGKNVVSWGSYKAGVIGVTYLWSAGGRMLETDTILNTYYQWSLSGEPGKMDTQNIMTHEFGHWCGLNDLYNGRDYWLTMYGYSNFGETYKQTLGLGDVNGLRKVYGA